jgi:hypothetical protein
MFAAPDWILIGVKDVSVELHEVQQVHSVGLQNCFEVAAVQGALSG